MLMWQTFLKKKYQKNEAWFYELDKKTIPLQKKQIPVSYLENGERRTKNFTTYASGHGPIMGSRQDKWLSLKENNRSLNALIECWSRTKASNLKEYQTALSLLSNNSNNTVYADADGNIAYWHGNFIPKEVCNIIIVCP